MKTLRSSDEAHAKLTSLVGRLMAESGKMKTYSDAIEALLSEAAILPPDLLNQVELFLFGNEVVCYNTKEEFIQGAIRSKMTMPRDKGHPGPKHEG